MSQRPTPTFAEIVRHPLVYALVILGGLVTYFVQDSTDGKREALKNCQQDVDYQRRRAERAEERELAVYRELLIKNSIINSIPQVVDSLVKK